MSLKQSLKACKAAIERNDPEDALYYANEALKEDRQCYYAYLFQGKAHQLSANTAKAEKAFEKAIALEPENLLGWKGYFQTARQSDDFEAFFRILIKYLHVLAAQNLPMAEPLKEMKNYLHARSFKSNDPLYEYYLRQTLPGTELADLAGPELGPPAENIRKLLVLVKNREDAEVDQTIKTERRKLPHRLTAPHLAQLSDLEWSIRRDSSLPELYQMYIDACDDDDSRHQYETEFLKYKWALLKVSSEKSTLAAEIKTMVEDLVLLDTNDEFTWSLNFDLQDARRLADMDTGLLSRFIKKFRNSSLGSLLYYFIMSDSCPFDKENFKDLLSEKEPVKNETPVEKESDTEPDLADSALETDNAVSDTLLPSELNELIEKAYSSCKDSMLAHRIYCLNQIHFQEYESVSTRYPEIIRKLAYYQKTYGLELTNCKEDILCSLAIVYTYYEAPKNFSRALQLYDKILAGNPTRKQALIGKGLILVARRELESANELLSDIVSQFPTDATALKELGWCNVLQSKFDEGRKYLESSLSHVEGTSSNAFEMRADIRWRIAKSYLVEDMANEDNVKKAYDLLILSLKDSNTHAASYTLLGVLYHDVYDDSIRAQKCFYKAFELDVSEITAAKYLVQDLAEERNWDITEILCTRVVNSEKSRRILFSQLNDDPDKSWPYRVLGCSALNKQDDAKAIEWFQTALRMQAMDAECWIGLGEAYFNCGRVDAAIKVFQHVTKIQPESWVNQYMLGLAVCVIGDYDSGLEVLQKALGMNPGTECILNAIYEQSTLYSSQLLMGGFVGRTLQVNKSAVETILEASKINNRSLSLWKSLGDCLNLVCKVQQGIENFPIADVVAVFDGIDGTDDDLCSLAKAQDLFDEKSFLQSVSMLIILAARAATAVLGPKSNKFIRSYTQFNLGLAYLDAFNLNEERAEPYRSASIECFKAAIKIEPENAQYWTALGNSYLSFDPQLAQHCYIKASVFDSRDVTVWSNLAALYLRYGDAELAQEAFDRATSLSPEQSTPWIGNALTAEVLGDIDTYKRLSTHAYICSNGRSPLAQLCYAIFVVNSRIGQSKDSRDVEAAQEFSIANFAIQSFLKFQPNNETGLRLALLLSERCQTYDTSAILGEKLASLLEQKFERTEDSAVLLDFAKTKTSLGRVFLGLEQYDKAIENSQVTLDLLSEEEVTEEVQKAILSSRVVIGLAFFFNKQYNEALEELQVILAEHSKSQRAVTLIAQVLHALGTQDTKQAAIDQLFSFIEENGSSLMVVLTLGAISVVENLDEYFVPIKEELDGLPVSELLGDTHRLVPELVKELGDRISGQNNSTVWQKFALLFPSDFVIWKNINAHMALTTSLLTDSKRTAIDVAEAYAIKGTRRELQRSLLLFADNAKVREVFSS